MTSASAVKDLREKTGAGMMDCKKALVATENNFEAAIDWLRTKGLSNAAKKADRVAAEGLTAVKVEGNAGAIIEVNSETDFVARNEKFQDLVKNIASLALSCTNVEELKSAKLSNGKTVAEEIVENVATIGEHISLRRSELVKVSDGIIGSYVHNAVVPSLGKISVLVGLESTGDKEKLASLAKQIAMHVAAAKPASLNVEALDQALITREKNIFTEQAKASGKPDNIIEKMVEGRIRKFYEEVVLLEQIYIIDGKTRISEMVANVSKEIGAPVSLTNFVRFELGEGIELEEKNFADEVATVIKR